MDATMESRRENNSSLEHRRAQNRMAQRRFRQRQSQQQKITEAIVADQQTQNNTKTHNIHALRPRSSSDLRLHVQQDSNISPADPEPLEAFISSSSTRRSRSTSVTAPNTPYGFGVDCLQGRNNGLLGAQSLMDMSNLDLFPSDQDSIFSSPLSIPTLGRSKAVSVEHIFYGNANGGNSGGNGLEDRSTSPKMAASLESGSGSGSRSGNSSSGPGSLAESLDVATVPSVPISLSDDSTPASSTSSSSIVHGGKGNRGESGSGWLSPLHIAAQKGHDRIVRVLLQHNIDCNEFDSDGLTPLIHATIGGYEDVVTSLLSHGAQIDKVDSQYRSALHWAVIHRREAVLKILLDHCMGDQRLVDIYDSDGRTPLHTAIDAGFEAGVQALLQSGANVHYRARKKSVIL